MTPRGNPKPRPKGKLPTSYHVTPEMQRLLRALSEKLGVSQSAILELLVREKAKKEGVE